MCFFPIIPAQTKMTTTTTKPRPFLVNNVLYSNFYNMSIIPKQRQERVRIYCIFYFFREPQRMLDIICLDAVCLLKKTNTQSLFWPCLTDILWFVLKNRMIFWVHVTYCSVLGLTNNKSVSDQGNLDAGDLIINHLSCTVCDTI